jgi:hypothetical protein
MDCSIKSPLEFIKNIILSIDFEFNINPSALQYKTFSEARSLTEIESIFGETKAGLNFLRQGLYLRYSSLLTSQLQDFPTAQNPEDFVKKCAEVTINSNTQRMLQKTFNDIYVFDTLCFKNKINKISDFENIAEEEMLRVFNKCNSIFKS